MPNRVQRKIDFGFLYEQSLNEMFLIVVAIEMFLEYFINRNNKMNQVPFLSYIANPQYVFPGPYAVNPPIVKTYQTGQETTVTIKITAAHKG